MEILVALFIMALASAMVVMVIPSRPDALDAEAGQFEAVLQRTLDQAISRGQAHGIRVEEKSYRVYARVAGRWVPASGGAEALPDGITMGVLEARGEAGEALPQIVADAAGILSGPGVRFARGSRFRDVTLVDSIGTDRHE